MSVNGLMDVLMDKYIKSKDKTRGVREQIIYQHNCNIILKELHGNTESQKIPTNWIVSMIMLGNIKGSV